jgi:hypothetical protein
VTCQNCGNEHGVTVLRVIPGASKKEAPIEIRYNGGIVQVDGRVLCWFCATPTVGDHL